MNPSAPGWIDKLGVSLKEAGPLFADTDAFYSFLRSSGFIYGVNVKILPHIKTGHRLTEEEMAKLNLITAFYTLYKPENPATDFNRFVESLLAFYTSFGAYTTPFRKRMFPGKKASVQLEKYIHSRVQIDENLLTKNFSKLLINFLLFTDVLAYRIFLQHPRQTVPYFKNIERTIINLTCYVLNCKEEKTKYHRQLIKLLRGSLRYRDEEEISGPGYGELTINVTHPLEKKYMLDIAAMAVWEDQIAEPGETAFIQQLAKDLNMPPEAAGNAMLHVHAFYEAYKDTLPHLNNGHFVKNFYDNASKMVGNLIIRNKKRLKQELLESKELVVLLSKATSRDLSKAEKKKVKAQLTDIFKAIPSLAIFALPGGSVLLPLFIKLIPRLLPSAFDENRLE